MRCFQDDEAGYVQWLDTNEAGFVANLHAQVKNRVMLHLAHCMHLYPPEPGRVHTVQRPKACSLDIDELERWARQAGFTVVHCSTCKPR